MKKTSVLVMALGLMLITGIVFAKENKVFTYSFIEKPKIGTTVFMVKLKDPKNFKGKIEAQYGMPSMSGAHDSGWVTLAKNKKGIYVTPVSFVMPGDWQIDVRITEGKTVNEYKVVTTI